MKTCPNCQNQSSDTSCFCQNCGTTLDADIIQGNTIVYQPNSTQPPMSPQQAQTVVQRVQRAFGTNPVQLDTTQIMTDQREHTVFVVDVSGSMSCKYDFWNTKLQAAVRANISMILNKAQIDSNDEIGIVSFDHQARIILPICPIHSHKQQMIQTLQRLSIGGGTDINCGLKAARNAFGWHIKGIVRRIVLLTDGHGGEPLHTAQELKSNGVVIDIIGVGKSPSRVNEKLLKKCASVIQGETRYRFIKDQKTLVAHYTQLANKTATF